MEEEEKCKECEGTGWILLNKFQDKIHPDMSVFIHHLYVECKCKKKAS